MKKYLIFLLLLLLIPVKVYARTGCCSNNGGVCGCNKNGVVICCNGKFSYSCRCNPPVVEGCTEQNATNYNPDANKNDGSCYYDEEALKKVENEKKYVRFVLITILVVLILSTFLKKGKRRRKR